MPFNVAEILPELEALTLSTCTRGCSQVLLCMHVACMQTHGVRVMRMQMRECTCALVRSVWTVHWGLPRAWDSVLVSGFWGVGGRDEVSDEPPPQQPQPSWD